MDWSEARRFATQQFTAAAAGSKFFCPCLQASEAYFRFGVSSAEAAPWAAQILDSASGSTWPPIFMRWTSGARPLINRWSAMTTCRATLLPTEPREPRSAPARPGKDKLQKDPLLHDGLLEDRLRRRW